MATGIEILYLSLRRRTLRIEIQLRSLSDGKCHPAARLPTIRYSRGGIHERSLRLVSITTSRIATLVDLEGGSRLVVWDWKSAEVLFVCRLFDHGLTMTLKHSAGH